MSRTTRLTLALVFNLLLTVGLAVAGRIAHSTSLLADAGHNLTDAMAILLALVAAMLATRPATERRSFGYDRASILAALANGVVLVIVTVTISTLAIARLANPQPVHGGIILIAASVSIVLNLGVVLLLVEDHHDLGVRSALIHALGDTLSAGVVAFAGLVAMIASGPLSERIDPIASLLVAGFIVIEAVRVTGTSVQVLLEGVPADIDLNKVRRSLAAITGVVEVHDLHVWSISSSNRALSAHLVVEGDPAISSAGELLAEVRTLLSTEYRIDHATIELEGEGHCDHASHP